MKRLALGIACLLLAALSGPPVALATPVVTAGSASVNVGDVFTIPISITGTSDLTFWQFNLSFNPAIISANSVTEGPFMSAFGTTLFSAGVIDNTTGLISLVTDSYVDLPPDPSGSGVLADIEFTALAAGVPPVTLSDVFLNLSDQGFEIVNGEVRVLAPEPGTVALLSLGLSALGVGRWAGGRRARARVSAAPGAGAGRAV